MSGAKFDERKSVRLSQRSPPAGDNCFQQVVVRVETVVYLDLQRHQKIPIEQEDGSKQKASQPGVEETNEFHEFDADVVVKVS